MIRGHRHRSPGRRRGFSNSRAGPAARALRDAIDDGRDLEMRIDRLGDARQFAALVEFGDEGVDVSEHRSSLSAHTEARRDTETRKIMKDDGERGDGAVGRRDVRRRPCAHVPHV